MLKILLPLLLLVFPLCPQAGEKLDLLQKGFTAEYEMRVGGLKVGQITRTVSVSGNKIRITSKGEPAGVAKASFKDKLRESSTAKWKNGKLLSLVYHAIQSGGERSFDESIYFDHKNKEIHHSREEQVFPLIDNSYDLQTIQLAVMLHLQKSRQPFVFGVADQNGFYIYDARVVGEEEIVTPYGQLKTVKLEGLSREDENMFNFWCAPELDYLPVRIEYEDPELGVIKLTELKSLNTKKGKQPDLFDDEEDDM